MVCARAHGKAPTPTHHAFMKNKATGSFVSKHKSHERGGAGAGGGTHYSEPQESTNVGRAGEKEFAGMPMHHK